MRMKFLAGLTALAMGRAAAGMFIQPDQVPVERLEKNIRAYVKAHPKEADGYYTLGRVNYLAASLKTHSIGVYGKTATTKKLPSVARDLFQHGPENGKANPVTTEELTAYVRAAAENFRKAIRIDPKNALYHLSLGSVLEATPADVATGMGVPPGDDGRVSEEDVARAEKDVVRLGDADEKVRDAATGELRKSGRAGVAAVKKWKGPESDAEVRARVAQVVKGYWEERAIQEYQRAYDLAIGRDLEMTAQPMLGMREVVSYEAAERYVALTARRPRSDPEAAAAENMRAAMKELQGKPPGPITPIIFSPAGGSRLADLVDENKRVNFDLDGTARGWQWDWVKPATGLLVWDPAHQGRITSGRQLFGNVTFGLFWKSGYAALASLDDNADGELTGSELAGLAVWFDRNGNGTSDAGEVIPIEGTGVAGLSVNATGVDGESPCHATGLRTSDGGLFATYDWVAQPARR